MSTSSYVGAQQRSYNAGTDANRSGIDKGQDATKGAQLSPYYYYKKALIDLVDEQYFMPLADVRAMPKHMGKTIKQYHYLPLLDDRNINDQGIDAAGAAILNTTYKVTLPALVLTYAVSTEADNALAAINAVRSGTAAKTGSGPFIITNSLVDLGTTTAALSANVAATVRGAVVRQGSGNLYGSSKDVGTIRGSFPTLSETGGRVNRVGFTRKTIEATIQKMGFFDEYTQESLDFDSDEELEMHVTRESLRGANKLTEAALQIDLLEGADTVYPSTATSRATVAAGMVLTYTMLKKFEIQLNQAKCPKSTTIISGSRMIDTRVVGNCRVLYIGSELQEGVENIVNSALAAALTAAGAGSGLGQGAFVPVEQYAAAGTLLNGEIGKVGNFRIVVVPEMLHYANQGAGGINLYPALVVGSGSFTSIGFQTSGSSVKFTMYHKRPGEGMVSRDDPYGETGLHSIKWWYGTMILRKEWLVKALVAAV